MFGSTPVPVTHPNLHIRRHVSETDQGVLQVVVSSYEVKMVSTRSKQTTDEPSTGEKRTAPNIENKGGVSKKAKVEKDQKLEVGDNRDVELKKEEEGKQDKGEDDKAEDANDGNGQGEAKEGADAREGSGHAEGKTRSGPGETKQEVGLSGKVRLMAGRRAGRQDSRGISRSRARRAEAWYARFTVLLKDC